MNTSATTIHRTAYRSCSRDLRISSITSPRSSKPMTRVNQTNVLNRDVHGNIIRGIQRRSLFQALSMNQTMGNAAPTDRGVTSPML